MTFIPPDSSTIAALKARACETLNAQSASPLLLLGEHAGNAVPEPWGTLGLDPSLFDTHYGYDPGVDWLTRALAERLDAPAVIAAWSRIFVDCNRFADDWDHIRPDLGGIPVPGNIAAGEAERALRRTVTVEPFDEAVRAVHAGRKAVVSVHSFTPVMAGHTRPVDIGILWRQDSPFVRRTIDDLTRRAAGEGLRIGDNAPYDWRTAVAYSLQVHALDHGLPCFYLEVNNALFADPQKAALVARLVGETLEAVIAEQG